MASAPFRMPVSRPSVKLGPEHNPWFWFPSRAGVVNAPGWFQSELERISSDLAVTWNPITERWQVWVRAPRLQAPICQGWRLLFIHKDVNGDHMPLDERLLARLHLIDMKNTSAKEYFNRVQSEVERDKERAEKTRFSDTMDIMTERGWDHSRIQVSMRGQSDGSKFSKYHS